MTTAAQAIAKAKSTSRWAVGMCDQFVAEMYGFNSSGYATAVKNWNATPANLKHPHDWNAPAGALMFWAGGSTGAGHVAISLGNGTIVSTDATGPGIVATIPAKTPSDKWGHPYLGWTYPYFQGKQATKTLEGFTGSTSVATPTDLTGLSVTPESIATSLTGTMSQSIMGLFTSFVWIFETLAGMILMGAGIYLIARETRT